MHGMREGELVVGMIMFRAYAMFLWFLVRGVCVGSNKWARRDGERYRILGWRDQAVCSSLGITMSRLGIKYWEGDYGAREDRRELIFPLP